MATDFLDRFPAPPMMPSAPQREHLIDRVERVLAAHSFAPPKAVKSEKLASDPAITPYAGQFFRVELLDHIRICSEEGCSNETRLAVSTHEDATGAPYCNAHVHGLFADWMVGP